VLDRMTLRQKDQLAPVYADLVYNGQWFSPLKEALDAFVNKTQEVVTGEVKVKLYKGQATAVARKSEYGLYREDLATFGEDDVYRQADSEGFIRLFGLPTRVAAARDRIVKESNAEVSG
jgi:argininosuccinate synthase